MALASGVIARPDFPAAVEATEEVQGDAPVTIDAILQADNVADLLADSVLAEIGAKVVREYKIDDNSRSDWKDRYSKALDLAMQVAAKKDYPWPNAANIKYPLLTAAALQFGARAYPAIINGRDVVKGQIRGSDDGVPAIDPRTRQPAVQQGPDGQPVPVWQVQPGAKQQRADRVAAHMSYQLTEEMEEWEPDTDRLVHMLPILGCMFRKTYHIDGRNVSELVSAMDLVVNQAAPSLERAPRITHRFERYPNEIAERVRLGTWRDVDLGLAPNSNGDVDAPHVFLEQHRWLDLDDDGVQEPYCVTVHEQTTQVVRIVPRFDKTTVVKNVLGRPVKFDAIHYFTQYDFLPAPDGSFYGIGFGWLLFPLNEAINTTINQMLDAGHLQNTGGGFIGSGLRLRGGAMRMRPGEYKFVQATGGSIRENIVPLQHPGPSSVLFSLLGLLIEGAQDVSSVKDIMTGGEGPANEAATRALARIEQGMKVFSAIYKRIFRSLKSEFGKLYRLNALNLPDQAYFRFHDAQQAVARQDYAQGDMDVIPVADPNVVTDMQRMAKAEFLMPFMADPLFDPFEVRRRVLEAANIPEIDKLLVKTPPANPEAEIRAVELENDRNLTMLKEREVQVREREIALKEREFELRALEGAVDRETARNEAARADMGREQEMQAKDAENRQNLSQQAEAHRQKVQQAQEMHDQRMEQAREAAAVKLETQRRPAE